MKSREDFERRVEDVKARAHGHWPGILLHLGLDEKMIVRKANMPCPMCAGIDRFQFTDKFGEGNYYCRGCGPGGGLKLAQAVTGMDFNTILQAVERYLGLNPPAPSGASGLSGANMKKLMQRIWDEACPVTAGNDAGKYLSSRGLDLEQYPAALRFHPALGYYGKDSNGRSKKLGEHAAMLASIQSPDGRIVSLHRTYLHQGRKLPTADAKKVLSSGINGAAIRLWMPDHELAITESIENGIAVHLRSGKPVWSAICAGNLEKLWLPETVRKVSIYADNDANGDFTGQAFAFALARRLKREDRQREVRVFVPKNDGEDWADVWLRRWHAERRLAA